MRIFFVIATIIILFLGCTSRDEASETNDLNTEWAVDETDVTGQFFLFPLAINPDFDSVNNINLDTSQLVGVINFGLQVIVYPYVYTFENEIINAEYSGRKYAFTYCPITKSAIAFNRTEIFRASGYLYKDNLTPWDDATESIWSQMLLKGIKGDNKNKRFSTIPVIETTWGTVKSVFPNAKVLAGVPSSSSSSSSKSFSSKFNKTPPEDESEENNSDIEKPNAGEHVYGIIDNFDNVHIFRYSNFRNRVIKKTIGNQDYIIIGNPSMRFINAFKVADFNNYD